MMKKNRILIVHKGRFDDFPPLMSVKNALNNNGYIVDVLTTEMQNTSLFDELESFYVVRNKRSVPFLSNLVWFIRFMILLNKLLKNGKYNFFWIEGGDTLSLFGWMIKAKKNRIIQLSELYDKVPRYKYLIGKNINKFNKVVVPEINRGYIIKTWYELPKLPYVLPNKPNYELPDTVVDPNTTEFINRIKNFAKDRKIILYQGLIAKDRQFKGVVDFAIKHKEHYCLVLMGRDLGYLPSINIDSEAILHVGFLQPPSHLEVTMLAHICLLAYDTTSLNKVYCAPNKIWEYAKFKKPMLSQNLPGIDMTFNKYNIGYCCDVMQLSSVEDSIIKIDTNYSSISDNTIEFYNSISINNIVKEILEVND